METIARQARLAASQLQSASLDARNRVLSYIREELVNEKSNILEANSRDVQIANGKPNVSAALIKRLVLTESKFDSLIQGLNDVRNLPDPLDKIDLRTELCPDLILERQSCPIGVLLTIYEARPEAGVQIASLALKSGNALILKGGKEAIHSNRAIYAAIAKGLSRSNVEDGVPLHALQLVDTREEVAELLKMDTFIDLVIPRGSNELVRHVKDSTKISVLGHADGICHVYVDATVPDMKQAVDIVVDSKTNYPAGCNSMECLLVHTDIAGEFLPQLANATKSFPVTFVVDDASAKHLPAEHCKPATEDSYKKEYLEYTMNVKVVHNVDEAIDHINKFSSGHTDSIVSSDNFSIKRFRQGVGSAGVYSNCSTRFADGFRYGFGAEVGISTNRCHPRGPVGLEGLTIYKYCLTGAGQCVGKMGSFTHKSLPV